MQIRAVYFDYDGVLTTDRTGSLTTNRYISQQTGIDLESIGTFFGRHNDSLLIGETTYQELWPDFCDFIRQDIHLKVLVDAFESTPINERMIDLAKRLGAQLHVGIITDNKKDRMNHLKKFQAQIKGS